MRTLASIVGATMFAGTVHAAEPTLETIPDPNYPFVQENADKAMKVAYIVAGKMCSTGDTSGGTVSKIPFSGGRQKYSAQLTIDHDDHTYDFILTDQLDVSSFFDYLTLKVYGKEVPIEKARTDFVNIIQIMDSGFDGHINMGIDRRTNKLYAITLSSKGMWEEKGKEHEPYFQDLYLKALDAVIAACEAKQ